MHIGIHRKLRSAKRCDESDTDARIAVQCRFAPRTRPLQSTKIGITQRIASLAQCWLLCYRYGENMNHNNDMALDYKTQADGKCLNLCVPSWRVTIEWRLVKNHVCMNTSF